MRVFVADSALRRIAMPEPPFGPHVRTNGPWQQTNGDAVPASKTEGRRAIDKADPVAIVLDCRENKNGGCEWLFTLLPRPSLPRSATSTSRSRCRAKTAPK